MEDIKLEFGENGCVRFPIGENPKSPYDYIYVSKEAYEDILHWNDERSES